MKMAIREIFISLGGYNMDEFYFEESNNKHTITKIFVLLFIIGIATGIFLYFRKVNSIKIKNITIEAGESLSLNVEDYLISGKNNKEKYILDIKNVNTNKVGNYTYKIIYRKQKKEGKIKVVDTIAPKVTLENVIMGINETLDPNILISSCSDISLPCRASFTNDNDIEKIKKEGTYIISITISDNVFNIIKKDVTITVKEGASLSNIITNDLKYHSNSENDSNIEETLFYEFERAILEDSELYDEKIKEISIIDFENYLEKEISNIKLITAYNKYGYVIGIQIYVEYVDGEKELLTSEAIINE